MSQQVEDFERRFREQDRTGLARLQQAIDAVPAFAPRNLEELNLDEGAAEMCFEASERRHVLSRADRFEGE